MLQGLLHSTEQGCWLGCSAGPHLCLLSAYFAAWFSGQVNGCLPSPSPALPFRIGRAQVERHKAEMRKWRKQQAKNEARAAQKGKGKSPNAQSKKAPKAPKRAVVSTAL